MKYRAIVTLAVKRGRDIPKGELVPSSYPRLAEALRRGWIVEDGAVPTPTKKTSTPPAPVIIPPSPPEPVQDPEGIETHLTPGDTPLAGYTPGPVNSEQSEKDPFDGIVTGYMQKRALAEANIKSVADLAGWDVEQLQSLKGIGKTRATQLIELYQNFLLNGDGSDF